MFRAQKKLWRCWSVNDETPDNSREIAEKFVEKYPEIYRIIDKKNGGHGSTVNRGIEEASGKYFKVVDGDDWSIRKHLKIS